jgi:hypothetical protein
MKTVERPPLSVSRSVRLLLAGTLMLKLTEGAALSRLACAGSLGLGREGAL